MSAMKKNCQSRRIVTFDSGFGPCEKKCVDDSIEEVAGDGAILTMLSGSIWKVDDVDQVDSSLWLGAEDVLICGEAIPMKGGGTFTAHTILNKDENGEQVGAARIGHK